MRGVGGATLSKSSLGNIPFFHTSCFTPLALIQTWFRMVLQLVSTGLTRFRAGYCPCPLTGSRVYGLGHSLE